MRVSAPLMVLALIAFESVLARLRRPPSLGISIGLSGSTTKAERHLDAIDAGDAVILAGLCIEHAVGIAAQGEVKRDMILMLADALLAAVLGEGVFGIEIAPVAIAADQAGAAQTVGARCSAGSCPW